MDAFVLIHLIQIQWLLPDPQISGRRPRPPALAVAVAVAASVWSVRCTTAYLMPLSVSINPSLDLTPMSASFSLLPSSSLLFLNGILVPVFFNSLHLVVCWRLAKPLS